MRTNRSFLDRLRGSLVVKVSSAVLGLAMFLVAIQGLLSYTAAKSILHDEIYGELESTRETVKKQIVGLLGVELARTEMLSREPEVTQALGLLFEYDAGTKPLDNGPFDTSSQAYQELFKRLEPPFRNRLGNEGIEDVILVCAQHGHVMFNLDRDGDLGTNLRSGPYKNTALARLWIRVVQTGKPSIEDYSFMNGPEAEPDLFMGAPVFDDQKRLIAVVIKEFSSKPLNELQVQLATLGSSGEIVLVGPDQTFRNSPPRAGAGAMLKRSVHTVAVEEALQGRAGITTFLDYRGVEVIGAYTPLGLTQELGTGFEWALVAKQDASEALAPLELLLERTAATALVAILVAILAGLFLALSITRRVTRLVGVADGIAGGDLDSAIAIPGTDEVGQLAQALSQMQAGLREGRQQSLQAEQAQRRAATYTRNLIEANLDLLVTIGADGKITDANRATEEATGLDRSQLVGTDFADYFTVPAKAREGYQKVFKEGQVRDYPLELRHRSGRTLPVLYNASVYRDEEGKVAGVFAAARDVSELSAADWLKTGLARLNDVMRGEDDATRLANKVIGELCSYLDAKVGVLYLAQEDGQDAGSLRLMASHAYTQRKNLANQFRPGEGLVGQAALEGKQIVLDNAPEDYIRVVSGLGEANPRHICVTPFMFEGQVRGVAEIATLGHLEAIHFEYLNQACQALGVSFETTLSRTRLAQELDRSRQMAEELQAHQEELKTLNEELQAQTESLVHSEEKLQAQQEELTVSNEELEQKNQLLERQKLEVETARQEIFDKAEELALASKYKSEFLANMSHELRTPLNSLLLLSRRLADNAEGNLTADQMESAKVVYSSGSDLLGLINEILDLSKIESGKMELTHQEVEPQELATSLLEIFRPAAQAKGLDFQVLLDGGLPATLETDQKRLAQILKNLVSNALKFTEKGTVTVRFHRPAVATNLHRSGLDPAQVLGISVTDTGIGIALAHHKLIFEAFQQADGSISRRFGGTGLGLSISRELARILGGEIQLVSQEGKGSTFTVYLPIRRRTEDLPTSANLPKSLQAPEGKTPAKPTEGTPHRPFGLVPDDRDKLADEDRSILIIEDDVEFARTLKKHCQGKGFKCLVATSGEEGLELARRHLPKAALLDLGLPGIDGWAVLGSMKQDIKIRHIPVHIVSAQDPSNRSLLQGAIGHLRKPPSPEELDQVLATIERTTSRKARRVLIVEDDVALRQHTMELVQAKDVQVDQAAGAKEAMEALKASAYDCVILDLGLADMDGLELLKNLSKDPTVPLPPVVIYTARDLSREEETKLREFTNSIVVKDVRSEERLLDEVSLFLHRAVRDMPQVQQRIIRQLHSTDGALAGKKVLLVDDNLRSAFALAKILADNGIKVQKAENGQKALKLLAEDPEVNLVLMDVMMPVMDGYEAIRQIRAQDRFARLPIIMLTAKAMAGDRDKCLNEGANDYLSKPVDVERLLSMMRVWLSR
jgi:PAS domain S-box-containing protein